MNLRDQGDRVSAVALVIEDEADTSAIAEGESVESIDEITADVGADGDATSGAPEEPDEIDPSEPIGGVDIDPAEIESPEEDDPDE